MLPNCSFCQSKPNMLTCIDHVLDMYPLCFFSQYQMARTKKTAQILRSLNMSASSSSSSDEDAGDIDTTQSVIPESMDVAFDDAGVPNAQDTVAEPTQREDEDVARGGVLRLTADSDAGHAEATPYGDECSGTAGDTSDGALTPQLLKVKQLLTRKNHRLKSQNQPSKAMTMRKTTPCMWEQWRTCLQSQVVNRSRKR